MIVLKNILVMSQSHLSYTKDGLGKTLDEFYFCGHFCVEILRMNICKYTQQSTLLLAHSQQY